MIDISELGLNAGDTTANATAVTARKELGDLYINQKMNHTFVDHLIHSNYSQKFTTDTLNHLNAIDGDLKSNLDLLSNPNSGTLGCYFSPSDCLNIRDSIINQLISINTEYIHQMNNGFKVKANYVEYICNSYPSFCLPSGEDYYDMATVLFPADNSTMYYSEGKPSLISYVNMTNNILNITVGKTACPIAYKDQIYDEYNFDPCPHPRSISRECMEALGAREHTMNKCYVGGCSGTYPNCEADCTGLVYFKPIENPL